MGDDGKDKKKKEGKDKPQAGNEKKVDAYSLRFPLAWGGVRMFKAGQKVFPGQLPLTAITKGCMDDESLLELLSGSEKKDKKQESSLSFGFKTVKTPVAMAGLVTHFLHPVAPFVPNHFQVDDGTNASAVVREMTSFVEDHRIHEHYYNHLFLYPGNFNNFKSKSSLWLQLTVKFKDNDQAGDSPGLPNVFGSSMQAQFIDEARSTLVMDNRPQFFDEIKINLPPVLTEKHHLLFTVYGYNPKKIEERSIIGHFVLPLVVDGRVKIPELNELPLITQSPLSAGYLSNLNKYLPDAKEKHQKVLELSTLLVSSVIPNDRHVLDFFERRVSPPVKSENPKLNSITQLSRADEGELVKFGPLILNQLLHQVASSSDTVARAAFVALLHVTQIIDRQGTGSSSRLLRAYATYLAHPVTALDGSTKGGDKRVHECLTAHIVSLLREKHAVMLQYKHMWFLMHLIVRFAALHIAEKKLERAPRSERFPERFAHDLSTLVQLFFSHANNSVTEFACITGFLKDLLAILDRGIVLGMTQTLMSLIEEAGGKNIQSRKLGLLKTLSGYYNYVPLNLPVPLEIPHDAELRALSRKLKDQHYVAGALVTEVEKVYILSDDVYDQVLRSTAINNLRTILAAHELDTRYQTREAQQRIAALYFPLLLFMVEDGSVTGRDMVAGEKEEWLSCFLYVVRNLPASLLRDWLKTETKKRQRGLLQLLRECATTFGQMKQSNPECLVQVDLAILETLSQFVAVQKADLNEDSSSSAFSNFQHIIFIYIALYEQRFDPVVPFLFGPLLQLIDSCPKALFPPEDQYTHEQNDYIELLMNELMSMCNARRASHRSVAASIIYKLLETSFDCFRNIFRVKTRATIAVSKIVGSQEVNYVHLQKSLDAVVEFARTAEAPDDDPSFVPLVKEMQESVTTLIQQNELIKVNAGDPEMLAALYHKIAVGFAHSPKLRLTWMNNLTQLHEKNGNMLEAAQCKMYVAALLLSYMRRVGHSHRIPDHLDGIFTAVCPNIKSVFEEAQRSDITIFSNDNFSLLQLTDTLEEAVRLFDRATVFELCLEVYSILAAIYRADRKYENLMTVLDQQRTLLARMTDPKSPPDRLVPVYFRVGFWGQKWDPELRRKEFIYKKPTNFSLPVFKKRLEEQFGAKYKREIIVLSKNDKVDESTLDEEKLYLTLAGTKPYASSGEARNRVSLFDQNFNISKFLFETGLGEGGKNTTDDLVAQRKKKTVFVTKVPFPYVENCIEVVATEEVILTPIQNAIELINTQAAKVQAELEAVPTRVNPLQQTLQGSVVPMVNPGPVKICEIFLNPERIKAKEYPSDDVHELMEAMDAFLKKCGFAVRLNKYVMEEKHAKFTEMIEKSYASLEVIIKTAIDEAAMALVLS